MERESRIDEATGVGGWTPVYGDCAVCGRTGILRDDRGDLAHHREPDELRQCIPPKKVQS